MDENSGSSGFSSVRQRKHLTLHDGINHAFDVGGDSSSVYSSADKLRTKARVIHSFLIETQKLRRFVTLVLFYISTAIGGG